MTMTNTTTTNMPVIHLPGTPTLAEWQAAMRELHAEVAAGRRADVALIFEPGSAFTLGKHSTEEDRVPGLPWVEMDRGGRASWAGPGMLIAVPVVKMFDQAAIAARGWGEELNTIGRAMDRLAAIVHQKRLEDVGIAVAAHFGVRAVRVPGKGGVWVPADDRGPARKLGNVGTRIAQGVTEYGIELHVNPDLSVFDTFTLCGLDGVTVTSLAVETGQALTVADVLPIFTDEVARTFNLAIPDPWVCPSCGSWQWEHEDGACPLTA